MKNNSIITALTIMFVAVFAGCDDRKSDEEGYRLKSEIVKPQKGGWLKRVEISEWVVDEHPGLDFVIEYSSMAEAEQKLLQYISPMPDDVIKESFWPSFFDAFKDVVMSEPSSFDYPFDSILYHVNLYAWLKIIDSDDGLVRFYVWEAPHWWTMSEYEYIIEYKWNDAVYFQIPKCDENQEMCSWNAITKVYTFHDGSNTYYLADEYFREWSTLSAQSMNSYILTDSGLESVDLFMDNEGKGSCVGFEFYVPEWYSKTNYKEGYDWLNFFDENTKSLYVPNSDFYLDDRYRVYKWDGKYFTMTDDDAPNPFFNSQLGDYKQLEKFIETERNKIRIDMMADSTYRYAAWKAGASMSETPELVIYNGRMDKSCYVFNNKGYEYKVGNDEVVVKKGKDVVGRWSF